MSLSPISGVLQTQCHLSGRIMEEHAWPEHRSPGGPSIFSPSVPLSPGVLSMGFAFLPPTLFHWGLRGWQAEPQPTWMRGSGARASCCLWRNPPLPQLPGDTGVLSILRVGQHSQLALHSFCLLQKMRLNPDSSPCPWHTSLGSSTAPVLACPLDLGPALPSTGTALFPAAESPSSVVPGTGGLPVASPYSHTRPPLPRMRHTGF